ncbi:MULTISPECIES: hypothetical protein [unclassified Rhizobium]|uniref:hypothetical protein n=1 Tax=unclassified Rhizobium TaxID=2613769 RepID=UPI00071304EE|nr:MULTISPECIES: hypothetical protein [unclassified Rhizobium]KQS93809.1 hypothetical protein ASG50_06755 [Rhizobium sp. Leaf386]KQT06675.1 hypothetical protein ASG42_03630 [Rhizobium sp. Leaf391]KQU05104.1 hypothetical protein ASG68_26490 [Rhizobium sp. Leaf453]
MLHRHASIGIALTLLASSTFAAPVDPFDKPAANETVKLPTDPQYPSAEPKVTCSRYADFMVKQVDLGEVGAEKLSLQAADAPCERESAGERLISDDLAGYFLGAAGSYAFFQAADGWNGGLPFVVFDAKTATKLFDTAMAIESLSAVEVDEHGLSLEFVRNLTTSCSLYADTDACSKRIGEETGLDAARLPDCKDVYEAEMKRTPDYADAIKALPSVIEYPVALRWAANAVTITPRDGATRCLLPS